MIIFETLCFYNICGRLRRVVCKLFLCLVARATQSENKKTNLLDHNNNDPRLPSKYLRDMCVCGRSSHRVWTFCFDQPV